MTAGRRLTYLLFPAAIVYAVDQITKALVMERLPMGARWPDPPFAGIFSFTHVANTGVAFGMFQGRSEVFLVVGTVIVVGLIVYHHGLPADARWLRLALGMQIGGALGNLTDRIRIGHVTDFFDFQVWPVFNIADSAIVGGVVLLALDLWRQERRTADGPERDLSGMSQSTEIPAGDVWPAGTTRGGG